MAVIANVELKKIMMMVEYAEAENQNDSYEPYPSDFNISEHSLQISEPYHDPSIYVEDTQEYPRHQNKIILGSKPSGESINVKVEREDVLEPKCLSLNTASEDSPTLRNLLIIESKSVDDTVDHMSETDEDEIKPSTVLLENWGPRLEASKCFCKDCEILFPTRNALDAHKMATHSFLVALDSNKAIKSTAKGFRGNVATPSSASEDHVPGTSKFCNHCNKTFVDDTALISHLYQILTSGKSNTKKTPTNKDPEELETKVLESPEVHSKLFLQCNICSIYFRNKISYEKHVLNRHGITKLSVNRRSYKGKCWFCPNNYLNKENYNKHVLRSHPTYYHYKKFLNDNINRKPAASQVSSGVKYQCSKCCEIFPDYDEARSHRSAAHPYLKNVFILHVISPKKKTPSFESKPVDNVQIDFPVALKIIYRCEKCEIHFTNCTAGIEHLRNCNKTKGDWECEQCHRIFMLNDKDVHVKQHMVSRYKLQVHVCTEDMYHRVMNVCPKCKLHFHEKEFRVHYRKLCLNPTSVDCFRCNISLDSSCVKAHRAFHEKYDFGIRNLIVVEFAPKDTHISLKRKLQFEEDVAAKKHKLKHDKGTLYYCSYCKCSMLSKRYYDLHSHGDCVAVTAGRKYICKICGIMVSSKRHSEFHEKNKNWKLSHFRFVNLQNMKVMNPPIPDYPTCEKCGVRVIQSSALENHECGANYKSCWSCNKKFTDLAYLLHVRLHTFINSKSDISKVESIEIVPKASTSYVPNQLPELLKKYEMLTETWNIIYLCCTCDIVHDAYDSAVEHCQNHFNKMESYDVTIRRCQTCDLKFDGKCFDKHKSLHSQNQHVRKESFHILYYNYEDLLLPKWLDIFQSLPDEQSQHILQQSIYKNSRNFKMTVIADGSPEYTLYVCGNCDIYSASFDFMSHVDCSKELRRYHCRVCSISFVSHVVRDAHEADHKKTENFRIVLFNAPEDSSFNKALTDDKTQKKDFKAPKESMVHYYRCTNCKCCVKKRDCIKTHECCSVTSRKFCGRCGLTFWRANLAQHVLLHKTNPYCTREHIQLTDFNPRSSLKPSDCDDHTAKIYKCSCGLHFTSSKTIEKHLQSCGSDLDIAKENCSKCNLLFDTHELFNHLCKHHSSDKYVKFDVEDITSKKETEMLKRKSNKTTVRDHTKVLYKCKKCDTYCLSMNALKYHYLYNKHRSNALAKCKHCGLRFSQISLTKHTKQHHVKHKYKLKDFQVIVVDYKVGDNGVLQVSNKWLQDPVKVSKSKDTGMTYTMSKKFLSTLNLKCYSKKIYKCSNCPLNFLSAHSLYSHKNHDDGRYCNSSNQGVKCNICGFNFSVYTLPRHKYIHHDKMKLQNVIQAPDPCNEHNIRKTHSIKPRVRPEKIGPVKEITNSELIRRANAVKGVNVSDYNNSLYKCLICKTHYLSFFSLRGHYVKNRHFSKKIQCKFCGYLFTERSLIRHVYVHHLRMKLKRKSFKIVIKDFNSSRWMLSNHGDEHNNTQREDQDNESDERDTETNEQGNQIQEQDTSTVVEDVVKDNVLSKKERSTLFLDNYSSRVYKCGLCDAHFLRPKSLLTHYVNDKHFDTISKCDECGLSFTQKTMRIHKHIHHNIMKLKKRDFQVIYVGKKSVVVGSQFYDENIYKCVDCDLHFVYILSADQHVLNVNGAHETTGRKCDICGLHFNHKALTTHKNIHHARMKLKLEDFKIQLIGTSNKDKKWRKTDGNESTAVIEYNSQNSNNNDEPIPDDVSESSDRISTNSEHTSYPHKYAVNKLYKCTLCSVHFFTENTLECHYSKLRGKIHEIAKATCSQCNLTFSKKILGRHQAKHHDKMKLEAKDFQIIPFSEYNNNYFGNNYLFRCSICKTHFMREYSLENHCNSQCHSTEKIRCSLCGFKFLKIGYNRHVSAFHKDMKLRRQDVKVWESVDGKLVPVNADDDDEDVPVKDPNEDDETDSEETATNGEENSLTESDKWKSTLNLDNYDNTIFKCDSCPLHFITLLTAKKHSTCRKDISNTTGTCPKCGLIFGPVTLARHMYIHHEFHQLNKEDFRVIERPARSAEKSSGVQATTEFKTSQMEKRYSSEQKLSRQLTESDRVCSNTLYRCNVCDLHFLTAVRFAIHDHTYFSKSKCSLCGLYFANRTIAKHKSIHHKEMKLKFSDFKIVDGIGDKTDVCSVDSEMTKDTDLESVTSRFDIDLNDSSDATDLLAETSSVSTNMSERAGRLRSRMSNASVASTSMTDTDDKYDEMIYRCELCDTYFMTNKNAASHLAKCTGKVIKLECEICNLSFPIKIIGKHKTVHHELLKLSRDDFKITTLGETIAKLKNKSSIETEVGLPDLSTLDKSLYNNELYKCSKCNIHFVGNNDFLVHTKTKHNEISKYHCTICNLPFSLRALPIHIFIHHEEMKLSTEHFFIITDTDTDQKITSDMSDGLNQKNENSMKTSSLSGLQVSRLTDKPNDTSNENKGNTDSSIVQSSSDWDSNADSSEMPESEHADENEPKTNSHSIKLYKCGDCNVYYMTQSTCYKHMLKHKQLDSIEYIECKLCGFQFRILSLHKHIMHHHNKEFKLENVLVEEYLPNENGPPKLDIYFANYKLQSRLVSTTSEKCTVTSTKHEVPSIGSDVEKSTKPCTVTTKDCIERESIEPENEQEKRNKPDKSQNIIKSIEIKKENNSKSKESEKDVIEIARIKLESKSGGTDENVDSIKVNNVSIDENNDGIEVIEDLELEGMTSEIESMIPVDHNINKKTENSDLNPQIVETKPKDSVYTETTDSDMDIIYVIDDDELVNTNSIKETVPEVGNKAISPKITHNKTEDKRILSNDSLHVDNTESENEDQTDNALLMERLIIDLSDEENQMDIENLEMETNKSNFDTNLKINEVTDIIEIE